MHDAFCKFWKKRLLIAMQGVKQTESHMKGEKYKLNTPATSANEKEQISTVAPSKERYH